MRVRRVELGHGALKSTRPSAIMTIAHPRRLSSPEPCRRMPSSLPPCRPGRFSVAWLAFLASLALLAGLVGLLALDPTSWFSPRPKTRALVVYCAAGLRKPVEEAARDYKTQQGVEVQLQYGGSETLLSQIE